MNKRAWAADLITPITGNKQTAEMVIDRLIEEGLIVFGHGNSDVDNIVETFTDTFGNTKTTQYDRFAANRLATTYGTKATVEIIRLLGSKRTEKYAPVVNNVRQLEDKFVSVMTFLRDNLSNDVTIEVG